MNVKTFAQQDSTEILQTESVLHVNLHVLYVQVPIFAQSVITQKDGAYMAMNVSSHAQMDTMIMMVFALHAMVLVTHVHVEKLTVVILVTQEVLDTYMKTIVSLHAQQVIMPNQLPKLVNHVTRSVIPVMDQIQMTVYLVKNQDTTSMKQVVV